MLDPMVRAKVLLGRHFHDPFDAFTEFTPGTEHATLSLGDFIRGFQVTPPTLEATHRQILSQSPTYATRFWWHLYGS